MGEDTHGLLHRAHRPAGHQAQQDRRERHRHHRALHLSRLFRLAQAVASERAMRQARHDHRSGQVLQLRVPLHHQHEGESPQQAPACEEGELEAAAHRPPALGILYGPALRTVQTFDGRVMSLLFNTLSRFIIVFLPKSHHLLILWLQSPSTVMIQ